MKHRVISLLLAIVLTVMLIPAPAAAVGNGGAELEAQIKNTYRTAQRRSGKWSFNGYCGSLVSWQTYLLGIDTVKYGCNGKDQYDLYSNLGTTTGGYRVECYPAAKYTLRSALDAITRNGTVDAYNMVVGFQKTNTREGSIYGHALFVHGIIDGYVYFVECYSASIGGRYWAEGTPICCDIDTFCNAYSRWTVFDGIAYFGLKTYADACKEYPASMYALALSDTPTYSEPADPGIYEGTLSGDKAVAGEVVKVTALLETPGGKYYYRIDRGGSCEYIPPEKLMQIADSYEDVTLTDYRMPDVIRRGNGFILRGTVSSLNSRINTVQVRVYSAQGGSSEPVMEGSLQVDGKSISLNTWQLDRYMTFRQLDAGTYRIVITAQAEAYALVDGAPVAGSQTVTLWDSDFRVVTDWKKYTTVSFDGNGGTALTDQMAAAAGSAIETLPGAVRAGYQFLGWSLDPEGTQMVAEDHVPEQDETLYAQWRSHSEDLSGWQRIDGIWGYYLDGGAISITAALSSDRTVIENWQRPGGALVAASTALYESGPCMSASAKIDSPQDKNTR